MKSFYFPRRVFVLLGTFTLSLLLYVDRACISTAKDHISSDLHFSATDFGWIMAIFTLGYALFQTTSGIISDNKGVRLMITAIVTIWSTLTALTGLAWNYTSMLVIRFLFGAGEAGAFPSMARVTFNWFPTKERGIVQGINFSGSRLGAAFAMPLVAYLIHRFGWRLTFVIFGAFGFIFAGFWYWIYRNKPEFVKNMHEGEKQYIIANRQQPTAATPQALPMATVLKSANVWYAMIQYIASNFTFYFTLAWMYPYLKEKYMLGGIETGFFAMVPLVAGACGNWVSGLMVDAIYKRGNWRLSRRIPAITGFALAALGMLLMASSDTSATRSIVYLSIAVFGADMTLSPSWAFCIDIGKNHSGLVSGTMNMAGNLGAFVTIIAFPYLLVWTGRHEPFFYICCVLSCVAIIMWSLMKPRKSILSD